MPEDRAARIVHRLLMPNASFEGFERLLLSQQQLELNRAVAFVADQIREATEEARMPPARCYTQEGWYDAQESDYPLGC